MKRGTHISFYKLLTQPVLVALALVMLSATVADAQVKMVSNSKFDVNVAANCEAGRAVFVVQNGEKRWTEMGEIIVASELSNRVISRRKMRFGTNQVAKYRVPTAGPSGIDGAILFSLVPASSPNKLIAQARLDCRDS